MMLKGKRGLILGVANPFSLAWHIAKTCDQHGARLALTYRSERRAKNVPKMAEELNDAFTLQCDLSSDEEIIAMAKDLQERWGQVDFVIHSVAHALREELSGKFLQTSREGFRLAMDTSVYSFVAAAQKLEPILSDGASLITISYMGSERVIPGYNVMGVAKAALEASVRYMAYDLGERGIRVNAISPGPINTLAARGIRNFQSMMEYARERAPFKRDTDTQEVADATAFLVSDLARGITGDVIYLDAGYHVMGM